MNCHQRVQEERQRSRIPGQRMMTLTQTKEKTKNYVVCHSLWHSRRLAAPDCEFLKSMDPKKHFMGRHNLLQTNEASGKSLLPITHITLRGWILERVRRRSDICWNILRNHSVYSRLTGKIMVISISWYVLVIPEIMLYEA